MQENSTTKVRSLWQEMVKAVKQEVVPAVGCTEPVSLALAAAMAAERLGKPAEKIEVRVSANMMKNGMGVIVPGTGMAGLLIAAAVGALGGDPQGKLEVLKKLTPKQVEAGKRMVAEKRVNIAIADVPNVLYSEAKVFHGEAWVKVCIADNHTHVIRIEQNGELVYQAEEQEEAAAEEAAYSLAGVRARDVFEFATQAPLESIAFIREAARINDALAEEGMNGRYGLHIGAMLNRQIEQGYLSDCLMMRVLMLTTAASDARMGGAPLPAITNSGSGNQGIAATVPVSVVARQLKADEETLTRALMLSHMMAIYIHSKLPKLSALCAVTTASMGAAAGMAWLLRKEFSAVSMAISSMIGDVAGMICDGAANSCAMKVSTAVSAACKAVLMALEGTRVTGDEGIVADDVDVSIANIGDLACKGMVQTDDQILQIMLNKSLDQA
ncbi:L-cysteine desulfidase [Sporomusaceae bacterium BoRhaA]|uniref:L-cysteine desulfidase family protein n=1 Tax=Pelorhabdus rhamnosifermentans TaxID=2772457 RepID=UPI001C062E82|nr:L-serine ammonia-lyase, iron-sulfur-dependent, subunit alpha [Pelorhabdus rhamnosifermentans]MBU2701747.1 L-cysteine desulfidase [Pelorhabdus rhamnosifermentans]